MKAAAGVVRAGKGEGRRGEIHLGFRENSILTLLPSTNKMMLSKKVNFEALQTCLL